MNVNRILKVPLRWLAAALAVVALGIAALLHGLSAVPAAGAYPATTAVGTVIHSGPWDVTIVGGRLIENQNGLETRRPAITWSAWSRSWT